MKTILLTLGLIIASTTCVLAADGLPLLNDQNIQKFIQVLPEYREIVEKFGENIAPEETIPANSKIWQEVNNLLSKYGLDMQTFPLLAQKISMGFAAVQMESANMGPMGGMFSNLPQFQSVTAEEKALLKKYMDKLKAVFEAE